ncbi:MAG: hypothetical protein U5K54_30030 [Cytophagales bacterium]|nr:hypothetical protein [Cytophagales bacterium]
MKIIIICLAVLLTSFSVISQGLYNKGATISIATQTIFAVPDSLVNDGTITNNGDLRISGAWINNGTYDAGTGVINFNSDLVQTINHNDQSFERLVISGTGEKQFSCQYYH